MGARPWLPERRDGLARGIYDLLLAGDRVASKQFLNEVQYCLGALSGARGYSAYQVVFGPNYADHYRWRGGGDGILLAQETSIPGRLVQHWKLRMMTQVAALKEMA